MSSNPNDTIAALDLAIKCLREARLDDALVDLIYLPALQDLRNKVQQEARGA